VLASVSTKSTSHSVTVELAGDTGATLAAVVLDIQNRIKLLQEENSRLRDVETLHLVQIAEVSTRSDSQQREIGELRHRLSTLLAELEGGRDENRTLRSEVARLGAVVSGLEIREAELRRLLDE
jgi:chromosome segregation ATPase